MMRGPRNWAVAVRKPDGEIAQVASTVDSAMAHHRALRLPILRGVVALGESLAIGFRALSVSANYAAAEEGDGEAGGEPAEIGRWAMFFSLRGRDRIRASPCSRSARGCSPTRSRSRAASGS